MTDDSPLDDQTIVNFFPESFLTVAIKVWGVQSKSALNGIMSSIEATSEASEVRARQYMQSILAVSPFLNENSLLKSVFLGDRGSVGSVVDFVGLTPSGDGLVLLEAKATLDSSEFKGGKLVRKFSNTLEQMQRFYLRGEGQCPPLARAVVTAQKIDISSHSSWKDSADGMVAQNGNRITLGSQSVGIDVVCL